MNLSILLMSLIINSNIFSYLILLIIPNTITKNKKRIVNSFIPYKILFTFMLKNKKKLLSNINRSVFQGHPFHLVSPSPWPIFTCGSLLCLATLTVFTMHSFEYAGRWLVCGLILVVSSMSFWFRDVISEGTYIGNHTLAVQKGLNIGVALVALFIVCQVPILLIFFWLYFHCVLPWKWAIIFFFCLIGFIIVVHKCCDNDLSNLNIIYKAIFLIITSANRNNLYTKNTSVLIHVSKRLNRYTLVFFTLFLLGLLIPAVNNHYNQVNLASKITGHDILNGHIYLAIIVLINLYNCALSGVIPFFHLSPIFYQMVNAIGLLPYILPKHIINQVHEPELILFKLPAEVTGDSGDSPMLNLYHRNSCVKKLFKSINYVSYVCWGLSSLLLPILAFISVFFWFFVLNKHFSEGQSFSYENIRDLSKLAFSFIDGVVRNIFYMLGLCETKAATTGITGTEHTIRIPLFKIITYAFTAACVFYEKKGLVVAITTFFVVIFGSVLGNIIEHYFNLWANGNLKLKIFIRYLYDKYRYVNVKNFVIDLYDKYKLTNLNSFLICLYDKYKPANLNSFVGKFISKDNKYNDYKFSLDKRKWLEKK